MLGLYESISALATKVNRLCCAVQQLQNGGGSSYKVYTALVTWDAEGLTDLNVLENTLGGDLVVIAYPASDLEINSPDNLFTIGKTFVLMNSFWNINTNDYGAGTAASCTSTNTIDVSFDTYGTGPIATTRTGFIEIRVYI